MVPAPMQCIARAQDLYSYDKLRPMPFGPILGVLGVLGLVWMRLLSVQ